MTEEQWRERLLNSHVWNKSATIRIYGDALRALSSHDVLEQLVVESLGSTTRIGLSPVHRLGIKYGKSKDIYLLNCESHCTQSAESFDKASWVEYKKSIIKKELLNITHELQELLNEKS